MNAEALLFADAAFHVVVSRNLTYLAAELRAPAAPMTVRQFSLIDDAAFHVVVSRNLTWNLPHPERAYAEWRRVLVPAPAAPMTVRQFSLIDH